MGNFKEIFFVRLFIILDCENNIIHFNNLRGRGVNPETRIFHERFRGYSTSYPDTYVYHYVYFCDVQLSADTRVFNNVRICAHWCAIESQVAH